MVSGICSSHHIQKQPSELFYKNRCSGKFRRIHRIHIFARVTFLIKLQAWGLQLYEKGGSGTGVFLWILWNFQEHMFKKTALGGCVCLIIIFVLTSVFHALPNKNGIIIFFPTCSTPNRFYYIPFYFYNFFKTKCPSYFISVISIISVGTSGDDPASLIRGGNLI